MIRALIIDDEENACDSLRLDLASYCHGVEVVAVCHSAKEGIFSIRKFEPDLVFLDVDMPWMNGFDMLKMFDSISFHIVFTTAHDKYAASAFRISAVDFLVKPIDKEELRDAVWKVTERMYNRSTSGHIENLLQNLRRPSLEQRIALPQRDGYEFIILGNILYCEAEGSYTRIYLNDGSKNLVSRPLGDIMELLPEEYFHRIHHSYIVALKNVCQYLKTDGGTVVLGSDVRLPVSRSRKAALLLRLGLKE